VQSVKSLSNADVFHIDIRVDRDTQDVEGAPDIVDTIFEKIKNSQIFVADISIINLFAEGAGRKVPNPNVLLELGYAAANIGWENVLLIYNLDFGRIDDLPFDLKMRRPITYQLSDDSLSDKSFQKRDLVRILGSSIYEISKKTNLFENHLVAMLYPFYSSKVTNIYMECDSFLEDLCGHFDLDTPDNGIDPPDKLQIEAIVKSVNNLIVNEELEEGDEYELGFNKSPYSKLLERNLEKLFDEINNDIEMLLKFKDGLNLQIISLLGKLLAANNKKQYLIDGGYYYTIPTKTQYGYITSERNNAYVKYYTLNSERLLTLFINAYELRFIFKESYSIHHEEFLRQEQERFNKY